MINLKTKIWQLENIETVLFDKDGTFLDLHYFWGKMTELRCKKVVETYNADSKIVEELCICLGYDTKKEKMLPDGITALYSRCEIIKMFKKDLQRFGIFAHEDELEEIFDKVSFDFYKDISKYAKPIDEAIEFIKILHSNKIKMGIVTADSLKSTELTLKMFGWEKYFDCVIGRESSNETKESGALTRLALNKLNANPKTTVMIGDTPIDYQSAINANIENVILVSTGQIPVQELQKYSKYCVESLAQIKTYCCVDNECL